MPIFFHCSRTISLIRVYWTNWPPSVVDLEAEAALAVRAQAEPVRVLLVEPDLVQQLGSPASTSSVDHLVRHSGPGLYLFDSAGACEPGRADAQEERLVDLLAVDAQRERATEIALLNHLPISGSAL